MGWGGREGRGAKCPDALCLLLEYFPSSELWRWLFLLFHRILLPSCAHQTVTKLYCRGSYIQYGLEPSSSCYRQMGSGLPSMENELSNTRRPYSKSLPKRGCFQIPWKDFTVLNLQLSKAGVALLPKCYIQQEPGCGWTAGTVGREENQQQLLGQAQKAAETPREEGYKKRVLHFCLVLSHTSGSCLHNPAGSDSITMALSLYGPHPTFQLPSERNARLPLLGGEG